MQKRLSKKSELEIAVDSLAAINQMTEKQRIELLIDQQNRLNNGDAMEFFDHWLDAVCSVLGIEIEPLDDSVNPFEG